MNETVDPKPGISLKTVIMRAFAGSALLRIAGMGFGFLIAIQLARALGPASYGIYGLAMSIIALVTVMVDCGSSRLVTREVAAAQVRGEWHVVRGIIRWARRLALLLALPVVLGVIAWGLLDSGSPLATTLMAGILLVPLVALANIQGGAMRGLQRIVLGQVPDGVLRPALFSGFLFAAGLAGVTLGPQSAIALGAASMAVALAAGAVMLWRVTPAQARAATPVPADRTWIRSATPIAYSELLRMLQTHGPTLLLGLFASAAAVGTYRAAASLMVLFIVFDTMLNVVSAPMIARFHAQGDRTRLQRLLFAMAAGSAAATGALVLPFLIWGETLVVLLLGADFAASALPLAILGVALVAGVALGPGMVVLNMTGHEREVARAATLSIAILVVAGIPLMYGLGAAGAALTYAASLIGSRLVIWHRCRRRTGYEPSILWLAGRMFRSA